MKLKYLLLLALLPLSVHATNRPKPEPEPQPVKVDIENDIYNKNSNTNINTAKAYAKSNSAALAVSGDSTSSVGDIDSSVDISGSGNSDVANTFAPVIEGQTLSNDIYHAGNQVNINQPREFLQYQASLGTIQIGDVSVSTSACGGTLSYADEREFKGRGLGAAIGCSFPIGGARNALKSATSKLEFDLHAAKNNEIRTAAKHEQDMAHAVETHQVTIAEMCVSLHRAGTLVKDGFADVCKNISFVDADHTPMPDVESHKRIGDHH